MPRILVTGGSGRLGTELQSHLDGLIAPDENALDITDYDVVRRQLEIHEPTLFLHLAAYTNVSGAEQNRAACWRVNVAGTRNVAVACRDASVPLVHISTDYVFDGTRGGYREDDPLGPAFNYYALSKLVAEEVARTAGRCLVIRTSFRPREWPYETAFTDYYTSQDYVDVVAPEIALAVRNVDRIPFGTLHIATERKSVFELARRRKPDVRPASRKEAGVTLPDDVSLDVSRWQALKASF